MPKWELLAEEIFATRALMPFIEVWHNREHLHSALNYVSSRTFEQGLTRRWQAAKTPSPRNQFKSKPALGIWLEGQIVKLEKHAPFRGFAADIGGVPWKSA